MLVVDDEPAIRRALGAALEARHYQVRGAPTGQAAIEIAAGTPLDAIILDLGLPDIDGVEVCSRIREWSDVPIIVLTVEGSEERKVTALDDGADDYVTKPFSMPELLARVRVALRHRSQRDGSDAPAVLAVGDLRIDLAGRDVWVGDQPVDLTPKEFAFLAMLARHPGRVLTHRMLLQELWGPSLRHRDPVPAGLRQPAAQEAGRGSRPPPPGHRTGRRLPTGRPYPRPRAVAHGRRHEITRCGRCVRARPRQRPEARSGPRLRRDRFRWWPGGVGSPPGRVKGSLRRLRRP